MSRFGARNEKSAQEFYGKGTYFAEYTAKIDQYTTADTKKFFEVRAMDGPPARAISRIFGASCPVVGCRRDSAEGGMPDFSGRRLVHIGTRPRHMYICQMRPIETCAF